ncbi:MAG TPA: PAS domain S-box protein [Terriglobales bacterium]|nr:PAS domain S-box protein [Terriglobales bacterium]
MVQNDKARSPQERGTSARTLAETVLETINTIVLVANDKGEILYASPSVHRILGYNPDELLGMKYWGLPSPSPELRKQHQRNVMARARGEEPASELPYPVKMLTRSGEERWILWRDARADGNLLVGAGQDITELKSVQDELKSTNDEIHAVFERANDGMLLVDEDLRYVDANPAACEMFGLLRQEILGRQVGSIMGTKIGLERLRAQMISAGEASEEMEYTRPDGSRVTLEARITANIRPGFHLVIVRDISTRRILDQQIAESQRMEAIGRLAGGVAHEFNNMLTAISGYSELILKNATAERHVRKYAQSIIDAVNRTANTTQQLLAFSRRQVIQPRPLVINDVIRGTTAMLQSLMGEDIQLILRLNEGSGKVQLDPGQLSQILINLALNARESMVAGGKLIVETSPAHLDHAYRSKHVQVNPGLYVLLAVSDTGVGIKPELQPHIFEPFFTSAELTKGTGLGLATVYGIVRQNNGHIWVYSEPGAGTTFKVYFPALQEQAEPSALQKELPQQQATILVIEDDASSRQAIVDALSEQGYRVLQSADGGEALEICESHSGPLALVVVDLGAPAMSGEDLRAYFAGKYPATKLLHMSGYAEQKLKTTGELPPEVEFLQKPFTVSDLLQKVASILREQ